MVFCFLIDFATQAIDNLAQKCKRFHSNVSFNFVCSAWIVPHPPVIFMRSIMYAREGCSCSSPSRIKHILIHLLLCLWRKYSVFRLVMYVDDECFFSTADWRNKGYNYMAFIATCSLLLRVAACACVSWITQTKGLLICLGRIVTCSCSFQYKIQRNIKCMTSFFFFYIVQQFQIFFGRIRWILPIICNDNYLPNRLDVSISMKKNQFRIRKELAEHVSADSVSFISYLAAI